MHVKQTNAISLFGCLSTNSRNDTCPMEVSELLILQRVMLPIVAVVKPYRMPMRHSYMHGSLNTLTPKGLLIQHADLFKRRHDHRFPDFDLDFFRSSSESALVSFRFLSAGRISIKRIVVQAQNEAHPFLPCAPTRPNLPLHLTRHQTNHYRPSHLRNHSHQNLRFR